MEMGRPCARVIRVTPNPPETVLPVELRKDKRVRLRLQHREDFDDAAEDRPKHGIAGRLDARDRCANAVRSQSCRRRATTNWRGKANGGA
jgi:hypothetical protein